MRASSVDEKTITKKGWLPKAHRKADGMRCMYCKELPPEQRGDDHTLGQRFCPNFAAGVALFAQRKALYYEQRTNIHYEYTLPAFSSNSQVCIVRACYPTFTNVLGLGKGGRAAKAIRQNDQTLVSPAAIAIGRKKGWNDAQQTQFTEHLKKYERQGSHYSVKAQDQMRYFTDEDLTAPRIFGRTGAWITTQCSMTSVFDSISGWDTTRIGSQNLPNMRALSGLN
jgi:hypothetical protein